MKANISTKITKIEGMAYQLIIGDYFYFSAKCSTCLYKIILGDSYNKVGVIKNIKHCGRCRSIPYNPLEDPVTIFREINFKSF